MRLSSPSLKEQLIKGLISTGCDVIDVGMITTPMIIFSTKYLKCDGGVMVTASHNPKEFNGFKFNDADVIPISFESGLNKIQEIFNSEKFSLPADLQIDVAILCGGSKEDTPIQGPFFTGRFNTVDSFDTHADIPSHFQKMDSIAKENGNVSIISAGWDPGIFSLERVIYPVTKGISILSMIAAVMMMFLVTADVFMRRTLNAPILGGYEIGKVLLVIVVFCGVAYVMSVKGHVVVDSLTRLYPRKLQATVSGIAHFFSLVIVALISWQSALYGFDMLRVGETTVLLRILVFPFIFVVAFGSAVLFLVILVQFIYTLAGVEEHDESTS